MLETSRLTSEGESSCPLPPMLSPVDAIVAFPPSIPFDELEEEEGQLDPTIEFIIIFANFINL